MVTEAIDAADSSRRSLAIRYCVMLVAWAFAAVLAARFGAVADAEWDVIAQLRLPRVLLATAAGAGLAVAGAALQSLFANPLCEPYTLGISSGAALGAALGTSLGIGASFSGLAFPAFAGAGLFAFLLYLLSLRRGVTNLVLLLAGVMLQLFGSSLVAIWMALAEANGAQSVTFWLLGDLSRARYSGAFISLGVVAALIGVIWTYSRDMDALMLGEDAAKAVGVPVARTRRALLISSALLVGVCVSGTGMIGFVGLLVPHLVRRIGGSLHRGMIPLCAICGAAVLVVSDLAARVVASPLEAPVGVVTALVGAPLFVFILLRRKRAVEP